jgi:tight adherence protein B
MILILVIGGSLVAFLLLIGVIVSITSERSFVEQRLGRYLEGEMETDFSDGKASSPIGDWLNQHIEGSSMGGGIARELARADLKLRPAEYFALVVIAAVGVGLVSWFFGGRSIIFAIAGAAVGAFIPSFYVKRQQSQRLIRFNDQLPDMLNLMVNGLRAGYSTMQAMEAVSKELPPPICDEFRRVVQEMQLGIPMERALDNLFRRIPSDDLDLTIAAINVQREVGGNLAQILDTITYTIRERVRIKGEIRVLTSQQVYSGRFLALLPLIIGVILWLLNRPYMMLFFAPESRLIGISLLGCAASLIVAGYFVMNKIAAIEV